MLHLYMLLAGCKPSGRHTEQHDVFFGIGETVKDILPSLLEFWPEAKGKLHIDAWRQVHIVDGYKVTVSDKKVPDATAAQLFFINLGGYKKGVFEEFHYKMVVAATDISEAIRKAKQTAFFQHTGFTGATSHVDDKYGIDIDDVYTVADILPARVKAEYSLLLSPADAASAADELHLGYFKLSHFDKMK